MCFLCWPNGLRGVEEVRFDEGKLERGRTLGLTPTFSQGTKHSSKGKIQRKVFFIDSNFISDYNKVWSLFYRHQAIWNSNFEIQKLQNEGRDWWLTSWWGAPFVEELLVNSNSFFLGRDSLICGGFVGHFKFLLPWARFLGDVSWWCGKEEWWSGFQVGDPMVHAPTSLLDLVVLKPGWSWLTLLDSITMKNLIEANTGLNYQIEMNTGLIDSNKTYYRTRALNLPTIENLS